MPDPNFFALPDHRIAFLLVCKAANTSVKRAVLAAQGRDLPEHMTVHHPSLFRYLTRADALSLPPDWLKLTLVRAPDARLASCWRDKAHSTEPGFAGKRWHGLPFPEFVRHVAQTPDGDANQHFRAQSFDLMEGGRLLPDFVGRVEDTEFSWGVIRDLCSERGLLLPDLPRENESRGPSPRWTRAEAILCNKRYARDLEVFAYGPRLIPR